MSVRVLLRTPGRADVVVTLHPGHYERVLLPEAAWPAPHVSLLLLQDTSGVVHDTTMHIDDQAIPRAVQADLLGGVVAA